MKIQLTRLKEHGNNTFGIITIHYKDQLQMVSQTLENKSKKIQAGNYTLVNTYSPKFRTNLWLISGVKGRKGIRIHAGNTSKDTTGCILVGKIRTDEKIYNSRIALAELHGLLNPTVTYKIEIHEKFN